MDNLVEEGFLLLELLKELEIYSNEIEGKILEEGEEEHEDE